MTHQIVMFTKCPEAGRVKTRLQPGLSPQQSVALYRAFVFDLCAMLGRMLYVEPVASVAGTDLDYRVELERAGLRCVNQPAGGLGDKMALEIERGLHEREVVTLIGSDAPHLPPRLLSDAYRRINSKECDVVLGPSLDGGFTFISSATPLPALRGDIPWSHPTTLDRTVEALTEAGLRVGLGGLWFDCDEVADLVRLRAYLDGPRPAVDQVECPRTLEFLGSISDRL